MKQISLTLRSWFSGFVQYLSKCFNVLLKLGHGIWCNISELVSLISYKIISDLHASTHSFNLSAPLSSREAQWEPYHNSAELFEEFWVLLQWFLQLCPHSQSIHLLIALLKLFQTLQLKWADFRKEVVFFTLSEFMSILFCIS